MNDECVKIFDWDKAAELIVKYQPLIAFFGMKGDGFSKECIYRNGEPVQNGMCPVTRIYTPELRLHYEHDFEIVACYKIVPIKDIKHVDVIWPKSAMKILNQLKRENEMSNANEIITVNGREYVSADSIQASPTQIIVAQRGWVFVGLVSFEGEDLVIRNAKNIRVWGTSRGLGELINGPLASTKLDDYGTVRLPALSVVARIDVNATAWQ